MEKKDRIILSYYSKTLAEQMDIVRDPEKVKVKSVWLDRESTDPKALSKFIREHSKTTEFNKTNASDSGLTRLKLNTYMTNGNTPRVTLEQLDTIFEKNAQYSKHLVPEEMKKTSRAKTAARERE